MNDAAAADQHNQVNGKPGFVEELSSSTVSHEVLGGIIAALVILIFVIALAVFRRRYMTGVPLKGVSRSGIYDKSTEITNQKAIRTDLLLSNTDH